MALIATQDCGCSTVIEYDKSGDVTKTTIVYCPRHAAAPTLYKTLQSAAEYFEMLEDATGVEHPVLEEIRAALALADEGTFRMRFTIEGTVEKEKNDE